MPDRDAAAHEAEAFRALIGGARDRLRAAQEKSPAPPRFLLESARSMAAHMGLSEASMQDRLGPMALWQLYFPSVLGTTVWDFAAVREHMPLSYERVRAALAETASRPQVVTTLFHMAAFPLMCVLVGAVWRDMYEGPLHLLVAKRNIGWFRAENNRWVHDEIEVVHTDSAGLRQLMAGLKDGSIQRLLILADGPQAPGRPGTRALAGVSEDLGIRTTLLSRIHALGIPLQPITHEWDQDRLVVTPRALLDPETVDETGMIDAVVGHVEDLLRRHPEQWLNWSAATIRT
jgi:hypothetical protein